MEPPKCIQNAMLTKDKKPFTYTPGGLNLSEIRSPSMARRIERNAAYEGISTPPPQVDRPQFPPGSLPPSAMAAMQPQMHVQVFPSGPTPQLNSIRGGVPPPPPPPCKTGPAPPPPPPMQPLPTQKVVTGDQQVVERPDMTKIIPDNPMSMLKKTGGPRVRNTLLDEVYREPIPQSQPQAPPQQSYMHPATPPATQQIRSPPIQSTPYQQQNAFSPKSPPVHQQQQQPWSPPVIERNEPSRNFVQESPQQRPEQREKHSNVGSIYIPPLNSQPQVRNVTSPTSPQSPKPQTPGTPSLKEAPKPWQQRQQQQKQEQVPEWARRETNAVSSPAAEEQRTPQSAHYQQQPPRWPQNHPSANVPQQNYQEVKRQQPQQQRFEPAQQRFDQPQQRFEQPQQRFQPPQQRFEPPQSQRFEPPQQRYEPNTQQRFTEPAQHRQQVVIPAGQPDPNSHPNAVFVTQPIVLQHPGSGYGPPVINRRENVNVSRQEGGSTVVIPIQMEGAESLNKNRNLGRQQSWSNNNPTQSGSFRVIQKLTGTDGDEPENVGVTEHGPRFQQQFPQEQMRKMNINSNDQDLQNRFKQVPNDGRKTPQVRNIPIQIEGGGAPPGQCYIPPSQQGPAEEPKKYTGSSIPSRSFKILQAMTAPDSCANAKDANETNENFDYPYPGNNWVYPPAAYPMYNPPPPYWNPYYPPNSYECYSTEHSNSDPEISNQSAKPPLQQFWGGGYPPPPITPVPDIDQKYLSARKTPSSFSRCSSTSELEHINSRKTPVSFSVNPNRATPVPGRKTPKLYPESEVESNRNTPLPFWFGYPPQNGQEGGENNQEGNYHYYPPYPAYYDPYYYSYYYGYPPMFSPLPYVYHNSETEDLNGYSSMDEMSFYNKKSNKVNVPRKNEQINISSETITTPTLRIDNPEEEESSSDSDTDTEVVEQIPTRTPSTGALKTIKSVTDINVYNESEEEEEECEPSDDDDDNDSSDSPTSSVYDGDEGEIVPHQLSVIFEVSERTETPRNVRECSVYSDCTTMEAKSDEEAEDVDITGDKRWISENLMEIASRIQNRINARIQLDDFEIYAKPTDWKDHCHNLEDEDLNTAKEDVDRAMPNFVDLYSGFKLPENCKNTCDNLELSKEKLEVFQDNTGIEIENDHCQNKDIINTIEEIKEETNVKDVVKEDSASDKIIAENPQKPEEAEVISKESSDSEDWWGVLGKEEEDFPVRKRYSYIQESDDEENTDLKENSAEAPTKSVPSKSPETENDLESKTEESTDHEEPKENLSKTECTNTEFWSENHEEENIPKLETTSAHSNPSNASSRKVSCEDSEESSSSESDDSDSSDEEDNEKHDLNNNEEDSQQEETVVIPTIKDRIKALQESIAAKKKTLRVEEEIKMVDKVKTSSTEGGEPTKSKTVSAKSSVKSFDEISEEDSGVTDLSRQFSDNEEFPELRKMSRYQRASTHSRLYQLLQEECENEEEEADVDHRKSQLTLPLNRDVNDRLAEELVQSILKQKRGEIFRNMSMDKLHAAAKKILQEDSNCSDNFDTPSEGFSEFLSPLRNDTGNSTPQEFYGHYNEYMQYYDSWAQAAAVHDNYESVQTKAFKSLQDILIPNLFANSSVKCPRVLSGKNVHSDLSKLVEYPEESSAPSIISSSKIPDDTKS